MKKLLLALGLALCFTALGGCTFRQVDELYALPKLPGDYQNLQAKIEEVTTGTGAEYSAPLRGKYTQPVQFQDLDGDGELEALAFFKVPGDEKPLKIYIFRPTEAGYEVGAVIEGEGASIYTVDYEDLNSTPCKELIVSFQRGIDVNTLTVFSVDRYEVGELMSTTYTSYDLTDIDMDNRREIMVINIDTMDGTKSRVECYDANKISLEKVGTAPLSQGIISLDLNARRTGSLRGATPIPAHFVTSSIGENTVLTDIFAWVDGTIKNITLSAETGMSNSTIRVKDEARPSDINLDSVLELPIPVNQKPTATAVSVPTLDSWYQYDIEGNAHLVYTTYHNFEGGWYFIMPDDWIGKVTVTQENVVVGEKRVTFGVWQGERIESFLTVYQLTGPNRHMRARMGENRFTIDADDTTIYCAEFSGSWDSGIDQAGVKERFTISQTEW